VDTLHHIDRENRAMALVFSYHTTSLHCSSDRNNQLTSSPPTGHGFDSSYDIPGSSLIVKLMRLRIAMIVQPLIRNALHLFMESQRMTPTYL
jgi:hypothetical protein